MSQGPERSIGLSVAASRTSYVTHAAFQSSCTFSERPCLTKQPEAGHLDDKSSRRAVEAGSELKTAEAGRPHTASIKETGPLGTLRTTYPETSHIPSAHPQLVERYIATMSLPKTTREYRLPKVDGFHNLTLQEAPIPKLKSTEVLIKIHAVSLQVGILLPFSILLPCTD